MDLVADHAGEREGEAVERLFSERDLSAEAYGELQAADDDHRQPDPRVGGDAKGGRQLRGALAGGMDLRGPSSLEGARVSRPRHGAGLKEALKEALKDSKRSLSVAFRCPSGLLSDVLR